MKKVEIWCVLEKVTKINVLFLMINYRVVMKKLKFRTMIVLSNVLAVVSLAFLLMSDNLRYLPLFFLMMASVYFVWYRKMPAFLKQVKINWIKGQKS